MASTGDAKKIILLLSCSEHGQANVFLATAHELIHRHSNLSLHYGTFPDLKRAVDETSSYAVRTAPHQHAKPIVFHALSGPTQFDAMIRHSNIGNFIAQPPRRDRPSDAVQTLIATFNSWDGPEYVEVYRSISAVVTEVKPDVVVIDTNLPPALAYCQQEGVNFVILTPNTLKEALGSVQPAWDVFTKYPFAASGLEYPLPWYQVLRNIMFILRFIYVMATYKRGAEIAAYVKQVLGVEALGATEMWVPKPEWGKPRLLANSRKETDFPLDYSPARHRHTLTACGPIIMAAPPIEEADPELAKWMAGGPVVFICLGTHFIMTEELALQMASALKALFSRAESTGVMKGLRVLWKLRRPKGEKTYSIDEGSAVYEILGEYMREDRVKVSSWLEATPISILESGHVVCSVNHGGASSYNEAVM